MLGHDEPACDDRFTALQRTTLEDGAWVDIARGWLTGHATLFDHFADHAPWRKEERVMYDSKIEVPRLVASLGPEDDTPPIVATMRRALDRRYETSFSRTSLAYYRDGRDSVAWHGDYVARKMETALVATVSLGSPRNFLLRKTGGGPSISFPLGHGDLVVMGGTCQRTYQHAIPKVARAAARIALMYRPVWKEP